MAPKKERVALATLTFNPRAVAYSFGMLANVSGAKLSYFVDEDVEEPVYKSDTGEIRGFVEVASHLLPLSAQDAAFFRQIIPAGYTAPNLDELDKLVPEVELPDEPSVQTLLVLGAPAVVDAEDVASYGRIGRLAARYAANAVIRAARGQVAVAFKRYEQQQAKTGPTLPHAVQGQVCTRFPPEPSGYLHIGHAKAAILNHYFARKYAGRLHFRMDDTNPVKENPDFVQNIQKDLKTLGITYDSMSYTSDLFPKLREYCEHLLTTGLAYCDQTPQEQM